MNTVTRWSTEEMAFTENHKTKKVKDLPSNRLTDNLEQTYKRCSYDTWNKMLFSKNKILNQILHNFLDHSCKFQQFH